MLFVLLASALVLVGIGCAAIVRSHRDGGARVGLGLAVVTLLGGLLALAAGVAHVVVAIDLESLSDCEEPALRDAAVATLDRTPLRPLGASMVVVATVMVGLLVQWRRSPSPGAMRPARVAIVSSASAALVILVLGYSGLSLPHADDLRYPEMRAPVEMTWTLVGLAGFYGAALAATAVADASRPLRSDDPDDPDPGRGRR
jgi:hypothetical protein